MVTARLVSRSYGNLVSVDVLSGMFRDIQDTHCTGEGEDGAAILEGYASPDSGTFRDLDGRAWNVASMFRYAYGSGAADDHGSPWCRQHTQRARTLSSNRRSVSHAARTRLHPDGHPLPTR